MATPLWRLSACYAAAVTAISLTIAASPVVGLALAPAPRWATLPLSLQVVGTMTATLPASLLMARIGRRNGFLLGAALGAAGALAAAYAVVRGDFVLFCAGSLGIGALNGFSQYYRFAATEVAAPTHAARAVSWVLAGGVVAGVVGPALAAGGESLLAWRFAGSYAFVAVMCAVMAALLAGLHLPPPARHARGAARPLPAILGDGRIVVAVGAGALAYGTMSLLMTAAPLSMTRIGHPFGSAALAIQGHVVAMFLPSFWTGRVVERLGVARVMALGFAGLWGSAAVGTFAHGVPSFVTALVLLGVGWNFLFIAATTLLAQCHRPAETAKVQGMNDLIVFGTAVAGSVAAGALTDAIGWSRLNEWLVPGLAAAGALLLLAGARSRRIPPTRVPPIVVPKA